MPAVDSCNEGCRRASPLYMDYAVLNQVANDQNAGNKSCEDNAPTLEGRLPRGIFIEHKHVGGNNSDDWGKRKHITANGAGCEKRYNHIAKRRPQSP